MASKVKALGGGSFVDIIRAPNSNSASKSNAVLASLVPSFRTHALRAMNEWINASGVGTTSLRAQKTASAVGLQLQEA